MAEWRNGNRMAEWRNMVVEWWNRGMAEYDNDDDDAQNGRNGGMVEWGNGGNGGMAERMAE